MRKVKLSIAMSLDGYIADKNAGVGFLSGDGTDPTNWGSFGQFFESVGDVVMGYSTYHQVTTELAPDNYPYTGKKSYVFTSKKLEDIDGVNFTNKDVSVLINELKSNGDEGIIWINGGASIVNQVLDAGLMDEICISVIPTILGGGIRLFKERDCEMKLELVSTMSYNGITDLSYIFRK